MKSSSDGGGSGSKKYKRNYGGAYGGVWRSLSLAGVWSQTTYTSYRKMADRLIVSSHACGGVRTSTLPPIN
jgi:hypothetical protein